MKTILIFSLLLAVTLAGTRNEEIKEAAKECGGPKDLRQKIFDENADQVKLGTIIFCVNKKIGVQKDNGDIDKDVFRKEDLKSLVEDEAELNKIVEDCSKRNGETPEVTAFNFLKCYETRVPGNSN